MIHELKESLDNKYYLMGWRDGENKIPRRNLQGISSHLRNSYDTGYDMAKPKYNPADDWKMRQANDDTLKESKMLHPITESELPFPLHMEVESIQIKRSVNKGIDFATAGKYHEATKEFEWAIRLLKGCIESTEQESFK